jgi:hypothetical protein
VALVLALHLAGLEWAARRRDQPTVLEKMAPPMYTRLLQPAEPPPVVAQAALQAAPKPKAKPRMTFAAKPRPKASEPRMQPKPAPEPEPPPQVAEVPPSEVPPPDAAPPEQQVAAAEPPQPAASAPAAAASAPVADTSRWPGDTRLSYQLGGEFRGGPLYGDAHVQWQRTADRYQVRLDVDIRFFTTYVMTSQGEVTPGGLLPRAYEEYRPGKRRSAQFGDELVTLDNGKTMPRPPGMQDTVSQFVELAHRFASGQDLLEVGRTVTIPLGRPGAVDIWTYDIVERVTLRTPKLGTVEAYHLKPRSIVNPRGNITAEMWFAPSLQYLPVRIQVRMGETDFLDLMVEKIEQ